MAFIPSASSGGGGGGGTIKTGYGGFGTPAKYVMVSTNGGTLHAVYFDQNLATITPQLNKYQFSSPSSHVNAHPGSIYYQNNNQVYGHYGSTGYSQHNSRQTSSNPSSSGNFPVMSASMMSVFGSPYAGHYADGSMSDVGNSVSNDAIFYARKIFNSDHTDKSINYAMHGPMISAKDMGGFRMMSNGNNRHDATGTRAVTLNTLGSPLAPTFAINANQSHCASYNLKRKELIVYSTNGSNNFNCTIYSGIDFDANPSPKAAFAASGVTKGIDFALTLPSWALTNNETQYNLHMILCNDGGVRVASWQENNGLRSWRFDPPSDGSTTTAVYLGSTSGTTSYGRNQGTEYGTSMIQTTDGKTVCVQAPYYYYHSGCMAAFYDKVNSHTSVQVSQQTSTSDAQYFIPYRDDGFILYNGGNLYQGNPTGAFVNEVLYRVASRETGSQANVYLYTNIFQTFVQYTNPNTTNYPMLMPTTDYHMNPYNNGAK